MRHTIIGKSPLLHHVPRIREDRIERLRPWTPRGAKHDESERRIPYKVVKGVGAEERRSRPGSLAEGHVELLVQLLLAREPRQRQEQRRPAHRRTECFVSPEFIELIFFNLGLVREKKMASAMELRRWLDGPAFHPVLHTSIRVEGSAAAYCSSWALLEQLPASVFFDPWQLRRLQRSGSLAHGALVPDMFEVDLEAFAERSLDGALLIMHGPTRHLQLHHDWLLNLSVPIHLRYHGPSSTDAAYRDIRLPPPELFLRCERPPRRNSLRATADGWLTRLRTRLRSLTQLRSLTHWLPLTRMRSHANSHADSYVKGRALSPCPPLEMIGNVWEDVCLSRGASARFQREVSSAMEAHDSAGTWHRLPQTELGGPVLFTRVPVGHVDDAPGVIAVTGIAIVGAALSIAARLI